MKYIINAIVVVLVGFPALVLGYLWRQLQIGFDLGGSVYDQHEQACMEKFRKRETK